MVQNLKKVFKSKISKKISFLRHEVPFQANNNREAVVVCARHVVKRPSKRMRASNKYSEIIAKTDISLSYYSFMVNEVIIQNFNIQLISQIIQINNKSSNKFKKLHKIILINFQVISKYLSHFLNK